MSNPALNAHTFEEYQNIRACTGDDGNLNGMVNETIPDSIHSMSYNGTINKSISLLSLVLICSLASYHLNLPIALYTIGVIAALILGIIICFKPSKAPVLAPLYAITEGVAVGILSKLIDSAYGNVAQEAVLCTMAVVFSMLAAYRLGIIKVTSTFRTIISGAVFGILMYYLFLIGTSLCGVYIAPLYSGTWSIVINLFICGIAAFSLAVDFENIKVGVEACAPKWMEWYCAYALMVTIIWIYLEILRLLASRRR